MKYNDQMQQIKTHTKTFLILTILCHRRIVYVLHVIHTFVFKLTLSHEAVFSRIRKYMYVNKHVLKLQNARHARR